LRPASDVPQFMRPVAVNRFPTPALAIALLCTYISNKLIFIGNAHICSNQGCRTSSLSRAHKLWIIAGGSQITT